MARAGDRFVMPEGSVYAVTRSSADTGGEYVEMEWELPADCLPPPPHTHPAQVEEYEVLEGSLEVMVDGDWTALDPGEKAAVPVGVDHTFRNRSGGTVRVRNWHRPAVSFEEFIETTCELMKRAGVKGRRDPRALMVLSRQFFRYDDTLRVSRRRDLIPMKAMAALGRLLRLPGGA